MEKMMRSIRQTDINTFCSFPLSLSISHNRKYPNVRLVTQNVDRLHLKSGVDPSHLIEVHGAIGLYRCINPGCEFSSRKYFTDIRIERDETGTVIPPLCPGCNALALPLTLLFDEHYASHTFYRNDVLCDWLDRAEVIVFVGTSFSVGVTSAAVRSALAWGSDVYSFNICEQTPPRTITAAQILNVTGPCAETLPILARECHADSRRQGGSFWSSCSLM